MTEQATPKCCQACDDGDGGCAYPYYGVAPHVCGFRLGLPVIGSSKELPQTEWPANYAHDGAPNEGGYPGNGVYTHCMSCGRPANTARDAVRELIKEAAATPGVPVSIPAQLASDLAADMMIASDLSRKIKEIRRRERRG